MGTIELTVSQLERLYVIVLQEQDTAGEAYWEELEELAEVLKTA